MKKNILTLFIMAATTLGSFAQGTIIFDSSNASGWTTLDGPPIPDAISPTNLPAAGSWTAALLFAPGTTLGQPIADFTQVATTLGNNGYISGPTVTIPAADGETHGAAGVFLVEGWTGTFANYAAAVTSGGDVLVGMSVEFVNGVGDPTLSPPGSPAAMTGWDGSLILGVPEPSAIVPVALGIALMVVFRRRYSPTKKAD